MLSGALLCFCKWAGWKFSTILRFNNHPASYREHHSQLNIQKSYALTLRRNVFHRKDQFLIKILYLSLILSLTWHCLQQHCFHSTLFKQGEKWQTEVPTCNMWSIWEGWWTSFNKLCPIFENTHPTELVNRRSFNKEYSNEKINLQEYQLQRCIIRPGIFTMKTVMRNRKINIFLVILSLASQSDIQVLYRLFCSLAFQHSVFPQSITFIHYFFKKLLRGILTPLHILGWSYN